MHKLKELLQNYHSQLSQNTHFDSIRNQILRFEIVAAHLSSAVTNREEAQVKELVKKLHENRKNDFFWEEFPYGAKDEPIGYSGTIPTAFAVLSLTEAYRAYPTLGDLQFILETCDALYAIENDGYLVKAQLNKSNVLNTNLLAAIAIKEAAELLPSQSVRKKLYDELTRRCLRKTIGYQFPNGLFPYHFDTPKVPILYHAMVCAQIRYLLKHYPDEILRFSLKSGLKALRKFFNQKGEILWNKGTLRDKEGAIWAYTFSLASLEADDPLSSAILNKLISHQTNGLLSTTDMNPATDPFFSAWAYFGMQWSREKQPIKTKTAFTTYLKSIVLKIECLFRYIKIHYRHGKNKLYNFPFHSGALENRYWFEKD